VRLALFDLDGTLLPTDSDHAFNEYVLGLGWVDADSYRQRNDAFYADYQRGCLDIGAYIDFATLPWRTATNDFVTRPIAGLFGVDELIATELARDGEGRVTGAIAGVPAFREGKVTRVQAWLASRGLTLSDLESSTFYSDSVNDLPLLEQVSRPVATNPSPSLQRIAEDRCWSVLQLFDS
jgi:phosphoserine phosphatase